VGCSLARDEELIKFYASEVIGTPAGAPLLVDSSRERLPAAADLLRAGAPRRLTAPARRIDTIRW